MSKLKLFEEFSNQSNDSFLNENATDDALEKLFQELVPSDGAAETVEGELVRAMMKIHYRYFNDGDYFDEGYGAETAGPAAKYLMASKVPGLADAMRNCQGTHKGEYKKALDAASDIIVKYIESKEGKYTKNNDDMLSKEYYEDAKNSWGDDDAEDNEYY